MKSDGLPTIRVFDGAQPSDRKPPELKIFARWRAAFGRFGRFVPSFLEGKKKEESCKGRSEPSESPGLRPSSVRQTLLDQLSESAKSGGHSDAGHAPAGSRVWHWLARHPQR